MVKTIDNNKGYEYWVNRWDEPCDNPSCRTDEDYTLVEWFKDEVATLNRITKYEKVEAGELSAKGKKAGLRRHYDEWRADGKKQNYFNKYLD